MTKTLAFVALVVGSLLAGTALQAQDAPQDKPHGGPGGPGMRGRPNADQIAKELSLTDEQKTKLKAAIEDQQAKMKALREDTSLSAEDKKAKAKELREGMQAKMKEILTPEQLTKWHEMQKNRGPGGKPGKGGEKPAKKD